MPVNAIKGPVFSYCDSDHPADLLDGAASVTRFLGDVAGSLPESDGNSGLSSQGANGLMLILHGVENTINLAIERL